MPLRSSEAPKPRLTEADLQRENPALFRAAEVFFKRLELAETKGTQQTVEEKDDQELRDLLAKLKVEDFLIDANTPRGCVVLGPNHPVLTEIVLKIKTPRKLAMVLFGLSELLEQKEGDEKEMFARNFANPLREIEDCYPPIAQYIRDIYFLPSINWSLFARATYVRLEGATRISNFRRTASLIFGDLHLGLR